MTALAWASWRDETKAVALLINAGASVEKADNEGYTSLLLTRGLSCLKLLLEAGTNAKAMTSRRSSILHSLLIRFVYHDALEVTRSLIKAGAAVDAKDLSGATPLAGCAASHREGYSSVAWASAFIEYGADLNSLNNEGDTPLNQAIFSQKADVVELLLRRRAARNLLNQNGDSVLHYSARYANLETIKVLQNANMQHISTESLNKQGKSPRQEVEERNTRPDHFLETFDELLDGIHARNEVATHDSSEQSQAEQCDADDSGDDFFDAVEAQ